MAEYKVMGVQKLDCFFDGINGKVVAWAETGEAYDGGFFIIKAVDLYWRGE